MKKTGASTDNLRKFIGFLLFCVIAVMIFRDPSQSVNGAIYGLQMCSGVIIPSLYPFTVAAVFFLKSGALEWAGRYVTRLSQPLFGLNGVCFSAVLVSLVGGYPVGAKIINDMYVQQNISKKQANILLEFCVNASPAFYISFVGAGLLHSSALGLLLFAANLIACFVFAALRGRAVKKSRKPENSITPPRQSQNLTDCFVESVADSCFVLLGICAWVVLFATAVRMLQTVVADNRLYLTLCGICEVTFGCAEAARQHMPVIIYPLMLSFGGLSAIFQVRFSARDINPHLLPLVLSRLTHGLLATVIFRVLLSAFQVPVETISNDLAVSGGFRLFLPSVLLLIFAVLFLLYLKQPKKAYFLLENTD